MSGTRLGCRRWEIPCITAAQVAQVDQVMIDELCVELIQMAELAGHQLACLARARFLVGDPRGRRVGVLAGGGANGGGGLVAARRMLAWCAEVTVVLAKPAHAYEGIAGQQLHVLQRLGATILEPDARPDLEPPDLIIDALVGYRLDGAPQGQMSSFIDWANDSSVPVLSLDLPSGLCATSGATWEPCVHATATVTLALPKIGLWKNGAHEVTGELYLADIGNTDVAFAAVGVEPAPIFAKDDLLRIG